MKNFKKSNCNISEKMRSIAALIKDLEDMPNQNCQSFEKITTMINEKTETKKSQNFKRSAIDPECNYPGESWPSLLKHVDDFENSQLMTNAKIYDGADNDCDAPSKTDDKEQVTSVPSKNEMRVINAFYNDKVSSCHYERGAILYRFGAKIKIHANDWHEWSKKVNRVITTMKKLDIRPYRIFLWNSHIGIDWVPVGYLGVASKEDYFRLAIEFAKFLDNIGDKDILLEAGSFYDENEIIKEEDLKKISYNTKFNRECFNCCDEIEIIDFTDGFFDGQR